MFRRKSTANASTSPNKERIKMNQPFNRRDFVKGATAVTTNAGFGPLRKNQEKEKTVENKRPLEIAVYLYPGMTAFDAVCPYDFTGIQQEGIRRKINEDCAESRMLATWVRAASSAPNRNPI